MQTASGHGSSATTFVAQHARRLTLGFGKAQATGKLIARDRFGPVVRRVKVILPKLTSGSWRTYRSGSTTISGRYSFGISSRPGIRYRILAPQTTVSDDVGLSATKTKTKRR